MKFPTKTPLAAGIALLCGTSYIASPLADAKPGKGKGPNKEGKGKPSHAGKGKDKGKPDHAGKGKDKGKPDHAGKDKHDHGDKKAHKHFKHFDDDNVVILRDYFSPYRSTKGLPPGLAKKVARGGELPPGWQKKLVPGYRFEDNLWKQLVPLPDDLNKRIRYGDDPYRYYLLNDRIVRVHPDNRTLLGAVLLSELLD
ncbi:hypothetical protein Rhal01_01553 [Rubritalea halochordaticola]|uniref:RcnB family protein n=1 Tax=Rubritalea halochordaticola TaxID=714537 RepID=A0ABP9UY45_9BACT